jgi:hypothetical protein
VGADILRKQWAETKAVEHQILALKMLFGEEQVAFLHNNSQCTSSDEELTKLGIVQLGHEGKLQFIHRTFGEFYAAGYFVNELTKMSNFSEQIQDLLSQNIFHYAEYRVVRVFIDGLLSRSKPSNEAKKQYGDRIHSLGEDDELILRTTSSEGNVNIIAFLLDSLVETGHRNTLVQLILAEDNYTQSAWIAASENGQLEVLHKLWELAEKELTPDEIKKLLLTPSYNGRTAWHSALQHGNMKVLKLLWEWVKQVITPEEIKKIFLNEDNIKRTVWDTAEGKGHLEILCTLWEWAKELLTLEEIKNMFLNTHNGQ